MVKVWLVLLFCLMAGFGIFMFGYSVGEDSADPDSEGYYEVYLVSIVDTLGKKRNVSGVKYVSERDGCLRLYDTLGGWFIIPIRDNVNYIKCTATDSVKCEESKK